MSQIMEKTLASLPKLLTQSFIGGRMTKPTNRRSPSQEVLSFFNIVHLARSKSHEAALIHAELSNIQQKLKQSDLISSLGTVRSCFTKIIFCHILGYDVSFAAIYAVNLAQQGQGYDKRLGYLLSCLLLHTRHDMVMLMMATLIRDLKSSNMANNCIALLVAGELVGEESIPSILPEVIKKLGHSHDLVKEKALHCLQSFYQCAPALLEPYLPQLNKFLSSRDPGILTSVTNFFLILCLENPRKFSGLGPSFLHILDQINHRGFGTNYYHHMVPLPWLQVSLLKILGCLGSVDSQLSKAVAPLLQSLIEKTKVTEPISLAVLVESVLTATKINANEELLNLCSRCIGKLLYREASNSMKYQGLGLLIALSRVNTSFAAQHVMAVVELLMDEDPAIQIRTTHLLHAMANLGNVKYVCARLFEQFNKTTDRLFMNDILQMASDLAERLAIELDWYIDIYLDILELKMSSQTRDLFIDLVLSKVEKVSLNKESISNVSLQQLIDTLFRALNKPESSQSVVLLSVQLFGVLAPVIGANFSSTSFLLSVEKLLSRHVSNSKQRKVVMIKPPEQFSKKIDEDQSEELAKIEFCCLSTISKLVLSGCLQIDCVKDWLQEHDYRKLFTSPSTNCCLDELEELLQHPEDLLLRSQIMFHSQNTEIDMSLSFLDKLVVQHLLQGGGIFKPRYVKLSEQLVNSSLTSPTLGSLSDFPDSGSSIPHSSTVGTKKTSPSTSSKTSSSFVKARTKWRDNEEDDKEQFLTVGPVGDEDENMRKRKEIAQELFAGLDQVSNSVTQGRPNKLQSKSQAKKLQNMWDDDCDDGHGWNSLGLHPFGIYKKTQPSSRWQDEDIENDNLSFSADGSSELGFISFKSEKALSPYSPNSKQNHLEIFGQLDNPQKNTSILYKSYPGAYVESRDQVTVPSIYSESFNELSSAEKLNSGMTSSGNMSVSTIDALTDSDPEETEN